MFKLIRRIFSLITLIIIIIIAIFAYRWFKGANNFFSNAFKKPNMEEVLDQAKDKIGHLSENIDLESGVNKFLDQGEKLSGSLQDYLDKLNLDQLSLDQLNLNQINLDNILFKTQEKLALKTKYYKDGNLNLVEGFSLSVFAENLDTPRVIISAPNNGYLVSLPKQGRVVKISDRDNDGKADQVKSIASQLNQPHGLLLKCESEDSCLLYVAENNQVSLFDYDLEKDLAINKRKIIDLPSGGSHWTRTIIETPADADGKTYLLISVGSTCNVCQESDWRRAKVLIANLDGTNLREYSTGLRNAVFMAAHPLSNQVWVTEMGRDWLGDDLPPDEINILKEGADYGWPLCYGQNIYDFDFNKSSSSANPCAGKEPSYIDIPAHSAPLGLAFIPENNWPSNMRHDLLVAFHGSWNSDTPKGYKIVRYKLDHLGNYLGEEDFISGWIDERGQVSSRPVDILIEASGDMYFTDDYSGKIYKLTYQGS